MKRISIQFYIKEFSLHLSLFVRSFFLISLNACQASCAHIYFHPNKLQFFWQQQRKKKQPERTNPNEHGFQLRAIHSGSSCHRHCVAFVLSNAVINSNRAKKEERNRTRSHRAPTLNSNQFTHGFFPTRTHTHTQTNAQKLTYFPISSELRHSVKLFFVGATVAEGIYEIICIVCAFINLFISQKWNSIVCSRPKKMIKFTAYIEYLLRLPRRRPTASSNAQSIIIIWYTII